MTRDVLVKVASGSVHNLGAHAEEMSHEFATAIRANLTRREFAQLIVIHPSFSEGRIGR
jgi:pyruvate/2-oxoglutarate dehydrogenase complex dihydrolipoamide dehydrogenase (E3) component